MRAVRVQERRKTSAVRTEMILRDELASYSRSMVVLVLLKDEDLFAICSNLHCGSRVFEPCLANAWGYER